MESSICVGLSFEDGQNAVEELDQPAERAGVHLTAVFAGVRVRLRVRRLRRCHVFDVCAAAGAVAVAVGVRMTEGVHSAALRNRLLAGRAVLVAGIARRGAACFRLVDRCQRMGFLCNRCALGDRLFTDGADLIAGVAFRGAGGGFGVLCGGLVRGKRLLGVTADILLAVVAIDTGGIALDRAGGRCCGNVLGVDVVRRIDGNCFRKFSSKCSRYRFAYNSDDEKTRLS